MARLVSYEGSDGRRRKMPTDDDADEPKYEEGELARVQYVQCPHPPITTELIARGIVRGYFYIVLISIAIAAGLGLLFAILALLGETLSD